MRQLKNTVMAEATCPDGVYPGTITGYQATWTTKLPDGTTKTFEFKMEYGLRGWNLPATITVANGVVTVSHK